jgi:hypothetical protein
MQEITESPLYRHLTLEKTDGKKMTARAFFIAEQPVRTPRISLPLLQFCVTMEAC